PLASVEEVGRLAADAIEELVRARPACVLGLATGSSPVPAYRELVARHRAGSGPSYDEVRAFLLDEYVGLSPGHPQSYRATIPRARHLLLIATGAGKAAAVAAAVEGPLTASCPASVLQLHPHATVLLDPAAASLLERADHYRAVYAGKPDWQGI